MLAENYWLMIFQMVVIGAGSADEYCSHISLNS